MRRYLPYLAIIILGLIVYLPSLGNDFAFDDLIHIRDNFTLRYADRGWSTISNPAFPGNIYRPFTFYTYYLQLQLFGDAPYFFHALNIVLHLVSASMVFALLETIIARRAALIAALLFVVHPLTVESVANVTGRAEILAALFCLSTILAARSGKMLFVVLFSFLAASSKESGVVVPLLLIVLAMERPKIIAALLGSSLYLVCRAAALGGHLYSSFAVDVYDNQLAAFSIGRRLIEALALLGTYLAKVFIPFPLSADYSYRVFQFSSEIAPTTVTLAAVTTILFIAAFNLRRTPLGKLGLWFFAAFMLTSNVVVPIGTIFAERLVYLPLIGALAASAYLLHRSFSPAISLSLAGLIIGAFGFYSNRHSTVWHDTATLADYQESISPESFRTQLLCAARDKNRRQFASALDHTRYAMEILPDNDDAYYLEGQIKIELGDLAGAERALQTALKINRTHLPSLILYGKLLLNNNQLSGAREMSKLIREQEPDHPDALLIELAAALKEGKIPEARAIIQRLQEMNFDSKDFRELSARLA